MMRNINKTASAGKTKSFPHSSVSNLNSRSATMQTGMLISAAAVMGLEAPWGYARVMQA